MSELRFASVDEALQHLANVSGRRVTVASLEIKSALLDDVKRAVGEHLVPLKRQEMLDSLTPDTALQQRAYELAVKPYEDELAKRSDTRDVVERLFMPAYKHLSREVLNKEDLVPVRDYFKWVSLARGGHDTQLRRTIERAVDKTVADAAAAGVELSPDAVEDELVVGFGHRVLPVISKFRKGPGSFIEYLGEVLSKRTPEELSELYDKTRTSVVEHKDIERAEVARRAPRGKLSPAAEEARRLSKEERDLRSYLQVLMKNPSLLKDGLAYVRHVRRNQPDNEDLKRFVEWAAERGLEV